MIVSYLPNSHPVSFTNAMEGFRYKPMLALCLMVLWPHRYISKAAAEPAQVADNELSDDGSVIKRFLKGYDKWMGIDIDFEVHSVCTRMVNSLAPRAPKEKERKWYERIRDYNAGEDNWLSPGEYVDLSYLLDESST